MRPSTLPAYRECSQFKPGKPRSFTLDGTLRHEAVESKFKSKTEEIDWELAALLDDQSIEGVEWAYEYIKFNAPMLTHDLKIEQRLTVFDEETGETLMHGHLDYFCGDQIFDVKWRRRNYREQMAAYALALMQSEGFSGVAVHLLYMESMQREVIDFSRAEAWRIVKAMVERVNDPQGEPTPCSYCGWCANILNCKPYVEAAETVAGWADPEIEIFDPEKIEKDPYQLGRALLLFRRVKSWGQRLEEFALDESLKGLDIPGFELNERKGRTVVKSVEEAFNAAGLESETFLAACSVSIPKLVEARRALDGTTQKQARQTIMDRLAGNTEQSSPTYNLKELKK